MVDANARASGFSPRAALWIGFLAGGWIATLAFLLLPTLTGPSLGIKQAVAEDPPAGQGSNPATTPGGSPEILPGIPDPFADSDDGLGTLAGRRGVPNPGGGTSDSNNRAVALSASVGGGESVVYYFDTVSQSVLVYQYKGRIPSGDRPLSRRDRGGLRLLAARRIDMDLRLNGYRDLSEQTRAQLKRAFDASIGTVAGQQDKGLPPKKVKVGGK